MNIPVTKTAEPERQIHIYLGKEVEDLARKGMIVMQTGDEVAKSQAVLQTRFNAHRAAMVDLKIERDPFAIDVTTLPKAKAAEILEQRAQIRMTVIRTFEASADISFSALLAEVMQGIRERDWEYLGGYEDKAGNERPPSMLEWIDDSFMTAKWRTVIKNYLLKVIAPLDQIEVLDDHGERITPERFIIDRPSFIEEVGPLGKHLTIVGANANDDDIQMYKEAMAIAASKRKEDVRDLLFERGFRKPRFEPQDGQHFLYEAPDPATGEVKVKHRFVIETDIEATANWVQDQLRTRVRFGLPQTLTPQEAVVV